MDLIAKFLVFLIYQDFDFNFIDSEDLSRLIDFDKIFVNIINSIKMVFFYISAPYLQKSRQATDRQIKQVVLRKNIADGRQLSSMDRTKFKLANLDTLMSSNDKLLKIESGIESFLKKVDKQYLDLQNKQSHEWNLKGIEKQPSVGEYLFNFKWNDSKYPRSYPIPRLVQTYEVKLNNIENELRAKVNTYNETRAQLSQATQKQGNYFVKDLTDLLVEPAIKPSDFIYTKFVTTIILIVPSSSTKQFQAEYELWTENVIPGSAKKLGVAEKDGLTLWKVNLFTADVNEEDMDNHNHDDHDEHYKAAPKREKKKLTPFQQLSEKARQKLKIVAKQFKFEGGLSQTRKKKRESLQQRLQHQTKTVSEICMTYFSEMFEMYAHCKMLRVVIESNMRFGSDKTIIYVINSVSGKEKNVQTLLVDIFGDKQNDGLYGTKDQIDDGQDFFPYVYVPMLSF